MKPAMNGNTFTASWGRALRWTSALSGLLLVAVSAVIFWAPAPEAARSAAWLPLLIPAVAALYVIRDYTIEPRELLVRRLLWTTRISLAGLQSAAFQPGAMRGSLRLWGNGGMFSITGWYRSRALGNYRAYVTHLKNTVVLRLAGRTIVVSPADPERFVSEIAQYAGRS
jgi:hypothetical protein